MAKDNDAYVRSVSSSSVKASPSSASNSDNEEDSESSPREEDVAAFDRVFAQFDPNNLGVVSMRDFLSIIDELDHLRPRSAKPLLTEVQREQSQAFSSSEGGTAEMTRSQLFEFIKEMTGNKIIIASPKKKIVPRKEQASPTKSDVSRGKGSMLPGISARSQVRPQHKKRRGDLEKMADGTTNVIAEHEEFSAVPVQPHLPQGLPSFNLARRNVTLPGITTSTPMPFPRRTSPPADQFEGIGTGPMSPVSPIGSPPLRPQDWQQDKGVQEYIGELQMQNEEQIKKLVDQERHSNARLREQDTLINELQERLDVTEDELKERRRELGDLRSKDARNGEILRSLEREVEARETELNSWRERYQSVKKNYDEQLSEADKLRDMILTKEGENNQLKEKITSLQEDIDTFVRVSWQFAGERQNLHETIAKLERELAALRKTQHALDQKELEAKQLGETVERLKFDLEEMRKRVNGSEKGTMRSNSIRSLLTIGRSDSVKGKPEILANELAKDDDESDEEGYVETVTRTEKRKIRSKRDRGSAMQVFNVDLADAGIQAAPSTQTTSTQTVFAIESQLANILRSNDSEEILRSKIDSLAEGLGSQRDLIDELLRKSKSTESTIMTESAVIRKHGPPPPYEAPTTTSRWPKFLTVTQNGDVSYTGFVTFCLWSVVLFLLGLSMQNIFLPKHDLVGLYPARGYASAFEMFGQRHWWEKWGMDTPWGRVIWRIGWWWDELLRGDGGWPS